MSQIPMTSPGGAMKAHRGTIILVLGIISIVLCALCGIFAWVMANHDLKEMDAGTMDPMGRGTTSAGKICGIIGCILGIIQIIFLVLWILLFAGMVAAAASGAAGSHP